MATAVSSSIASGPAPTTPIDSPELRGVNEDAAELSSDDHDVQSQIALETLSQREREGTRELGLTPMGTPASASRFRQTQQGEKITAMEKNDVHQTEKEEESAESSLEAAEEEDIQMAEVQTDATNKMVAEQQQPEPQQQEGHSSKIIRMLRSGMDMLRQARLSRQEFNQIEDVFMDMKRELYEAERRGRQ